MKIAIISKQPINSIDGLEEFQKKLERESNVEVSCLLHTSGQPRDLIAEIKSLQPDVLVTTDLAGFEQCTLTDNVSYNLLNCKQLHLLLHENLPNEPYLAGQLSIAMFFYCAGNAYYDELAHRYPNLPYLKTLPDGESLYAAFQEMLQECDISQ